MGVRVGPCLRKAAQTWGPGQVSCCHSRLSAVAAHSQLGTPRRHHQGQLTHVRGAGAAGSLATRCGWSLWARLALRGCCKVEVHALSAEPPHCSPSGHLVVGWATCPLFPLFLVPFLSVNHQEFRSSGHTPSFPGMVKTCPCYSVRPRWGRGCVADVKATEG